MQKYGLAAALALCICPSAETAARTDADPTARPQSQERGAARLECTLPGRREALHLRLLTPETKPIVYKRNPDPLRNALSIRGAGELRLSWNGHPVDRARLRLFLDVVAELDEPRPWLTIDKDESPLSCEALKEILEVLRSNASKIRP